MMCFQDRLVTVFVFELAIECSCFYCASQNWHRGKLDPGAGIVFSNEQIILHNLYNGE